MKHLLISGIEKGSTIFHLMQAKKRGFSSILLDTNTQGICKDAEVVRQSLYFFRAWLF